MVKLEYTSNFMYIYNVSMFIFLCAAKKNKLSDLFCKLYCSIFLYLFNSKFVLEVEDALPGDFE